MMKIHPLLTGLLLRGQIHHLTKIQSLLRQMIAKDPRNELKIIADRSEVVLLFKA